MGDKLKFYRLSGVTFYEGTDIFKPSLDNKMVTSQKHAYIILTPLNPTFNSKTGVYRGIHYFSYFCSKTYIVGTR